MMALPTSVDPVPYGPPKASAVDQMTSDRTIPVYEMIRGNTPRIKPSAITVSVPAMRYANACGFVSIR